MGPQAVHGASSVLLAEAEKAYRTGLLEDAEQAYVQWLREGDDAVMLEKVRLRLIELAVRQGDWEKARNRLDDEPPLPGAEWAFWRAQMLLGQGNRAQGLAALETLVEAHAQHALSLEASLTLAAHLLEDREFDRVERLLSRWERSTSSHVDYLKARLAVEKGAHLDAINEMERLRQNPEGLRAEQLMRVYFDLGRLRWLVNQPESSEAVMRAFLEKFPDSVHQEAAFEMLAQFGVFRSAPQREQWLAWSKSYSARMQGDVLFHAAAAEARSDDLTAALTLIEKIEPAHPLGGAAAVEKARWLLRAGNVGACLAYLSPAQIGQFDDEVPVRQALTFLRGKALFEEGRLAEALGAFNPDPPASSTQEATRAAAFNTAVTSIASNQADAFQRGLDGLRQSTDLPEQRSAVIGEALFQRALALAQDPLSRERALGESEALIEKFPLHNRAAQAKMMQAELCLGAQPPRLGKAKDLMDSMRAGDAPSKYSAARLDYLGIWYQSLVGDGARVIQLGREFDAQFPSSPLTANVRLRCAEAFFDEGNSAGARGLLRPLAGEVAKGSSVGIQAGFLEAFASQKFGSHPRAVKAWRSLIGRTEGEHRLIARHQQALTLCQQGNRTDAIAQWDEVAGSEPSRALLLRVLLAKGECLTVMADTDAARGMEAIGVFDDVLALPEAPPIWREEALYRKGVVHLRMKAYTEAMTAFNQVIRQFKARHSAGEREAREKPSPVWYYRAGFEAISLLEMRQQWEFAARLADEMAAIEGERSEEAKERAAEIRVRHFLW